MKEGYAQLPTSGTQVLKGIMYTTLNKNSSTSSSFAVNCIKFSPAGYVKPIMIIFALGGSHFLLQ